MFKKSLTKSDEYSTLPDPVALTPDQLKEIATTTAGGLSLSPSSLVIRAGGIPAAVVMGSVAAAY